MNLLNSLSEYSSVTICGWILIHFLWQGTLVALFGWIVLSICSRCSAQTRYLVAMSCLLVAAICPLATAFRLVQRVEQQHFTETISIETSNAKLVAHSPLFDARPSNDAAFEERFHVVATSPAASIEESTFAPTPTWRDRLESAMPWIVAGWFLGVVLLTVRLLGGWWLASRVVSCGKPLRTEWSGIVETLAHKLQIHRAIRWIESARIDVPQVIGWWKPVVLVPTSILTSLTTHEVECLLIHELAHIKRFDFAINLIQCVIETVLFFHPGVWWLSRRVRLERELACDETTVRVTGDQFTLPRALLSLADLAQLPQPTLAASEGDLTKRVHAILGTRRTGSSHVGAVLLCGVACAIAAGVVMWMGDRTAELPSETSDAPTLENSDEYFVTEGALVPNISGRILDDNGEPVPDAVVYLRQSGRASDSSRGPSVWEDLAKTTSDADGQYQFIDAYDSETSRVSPMYDIVARKADYALGWKHIRPQVSGANVNVTLSEPNAFAGRITNESGEGVPNASVKLKHLMSIRHITQADLEQGRWPSWKDSHFVSLHGFRETPVMTTNADGYFKMTDVVSNTGAIIEVAHPDYELKSIYAATVDQLDAETAAKTKRDVLTENFSTSLKRGYRVELTVVDDESGKLIPNVRYAETHKSYRIPPDLRSETGSITIPHLTSPKFRVMIYPPENSDYLGFGQYLEWPTEQYERKIEVRLKKGIAVTGQVVNSENAQPVAEVPVYATRVDKNPEQVAAVSPHPFVTDPQGRFTAIVPPGEFTFFPRGRIRGFLDNREKKVVSRVIKVTPEGVSVQPLLELPPAPRFRLIVTDPDGKPAPKIKISARAHTSLNSYMPIDVTTDENGEYLLDQLFMTQSPVQELLGEEVVFRDRENTLGTTLVLKRPQGSDPIEQTIEVKLEQLGTVVGRTVDESGKPVAGTSLWLYKQNYEQNGASAVGEFTTTDAEGRFELKGILPGIEHSLSLRHTRYRTPNSIHTHFTMTDSTEYEFGDIKLGSLTPPDVPELTAVTAPDVTALTPEAAFQKLQRNYKSDFQKYRNSFDQLEEKYTAEDIVARLEPTPVYCQEFLKLARRDPQSEVALKSCLWIVNARRIAGSEKASREQRVEAAHILAANFLGRPEMSECIYVAIESFMKDPHRYSPDYNQRFVDAAEQLMKNNIHRDVHARVCFSLSELLMQELLGRGPIMGSTPSPETIEQCRKYLTRVKKEFPEYKDFVYGTYGKAAERLLYDLDHMLVGQTPPDLEGTDVTGKHVKLSDYRGKLLIVDFWQGFSPASEDHHGLKHILKKAGNRVAVVGIVSDSKQKVLKEVEKYQLSYPVFADGDDGPLFTKWNIHTWPTTILLDEQGVMLHRGHRGTTLENLLLEKLAEE